MKTRQLRVVHAMIVRMKSSTQVHCMSIVQGFMSDYRRWNKDGEEGFNDRDLHAPRVLRSGRRGRTP